MIMMIKLDISREEGKNYLMSESIDNYRFYNVEGVLD